MRRQLFFTAKFLTQVWLTIILLSILNLPPTSCIPNEPYNRCEAAFNCGKLSGIGFPFWGAGRPANCGYAALKLSCENGTTTTLQINNVKYRVLNFNQKTKTLKIARNDLLQGLCPPQLVTTSLDPRLFEYASSYVNLTFLYGCPAVDFPVPYKFECAVKGTKEKTGYVEFGSQLSGMCHNSVVVPVSYASFFNFKDLEALIGEGFEVRLTVDGGGAVAVADVPRAPVGDSPRAPPVADGVKQGPQAVTAAPSESGEFYRTCGNTFSCGNTITEIGYPFRRSTDPAYCGHPSLVLNCNDRNNATTIDIMNTTYRVLEIYQATETMRIVREDMMEDPCPQEMVNTTLDYSLFDYAASYTNLTFLYGCPASNLPGLSLTPCGNSGYSGVYVFPGSQGPGSCNASVIVPVLLGGNGGGGSMNTTTLNQVIQQGFEVRWKIGGKSCSDCVDSKGRCGYDIGTNKTTCFCPDPPYVSDTCPMGSRASPGNAPSPGTHNVNAFYFFRIECLIMIASLSDSSDCFSRLVILSADNKIVQCFSHLTHQDLSCLYMDQDFGMNSSPLY